VLYGRFSQILTQQKFSAQCHIKLLQIEKSKIYLHTQVTQLCMLQMINFNQIRLNKLLMFLETRPKTKTSIIVNIWVILPKTSDFTLKIFKKIFFFCIFIDMVFWIDGCLNLLEIYSAVQVFFGKIKIYRIVDDFFANFVITITHHISVDKKYLCFLCKFFIALLLNKCVAIQIKPNT